MYEQGLSVSISPTTDRVSREEIVRIGPDPRAGAWDTGDSGSRRIT
jgi:hypothetical protein